VRHNTLVSYCFLLCEADNKSLREHWSTNAVPRKSDICPRGQFVCRFTFGTSKFKQQPDGSVLSGQGTRTSARDWKICQNSQSKTRLGLEPVTSQIAYNYNEPEFLSLLSQNPAYGLFSARYITSHPRKPLSYETTYSKSSFIRHAWGMGCADRSILSLERTVTYFTQF
jgi:hypothetical protein